MYAYSERFVLPFSHDEVVHLKKSMISKMPGDVWQMFANLRALYGYMYGHPGKKLLFMGGEFGQWHEWNHDKQLDWSLTNNEFHSGLQRWVRDLNRVYRAEPALYERDDSPDGFEWIDCNDHEGNVVSFVRRAANADDMILFACNFAAVPRYDYRVGAPVAGTWVEILNSDATVYGGAGVGNLGSVETDAEPKHGRAHSLALTLPPLAIVAFRAPRAMPPPPSPAAEAVPKPRKKRASKRSR
jgi:1,4-alpha-glucan branching enzyme